MKVLMCPPKYFSIDYEINPWMDENNKVDRNIAQQQWQALLQTYMDLGVDVQTIQPVEGLPDMVFTANAGLVRENKVIVSNFKYPQRKPESEYFLSWFENFGFETHLLGESELFEGQGEALSVGDTLIVGYGLRANLLSHERIKEFFDRDIVSVKLTDPRYYHLDTCFLPIDSSTAVYFPGAFDQSSREKLESIIPNLITVSGDEAASFTCNSVVIGKSILMPAVSEELRNKLSNIGLDVRVVDVSEFKKSGGGVRCLTLNLD